jgi:hypothetical protein
MELPYLKNVSPTLLFVLVLIHKFYRILGYDKFEKKQLLAFVLYHLVERRYLALEHALLC